MMYKYSQHILPADLANLPLYSYSGDVVYIDTFEKYNTVKDELFLETLWGFDTETKPSFKKGVANKKEVALLQLSSGEKTYLFRLNKIGFPEELINFLSSPKFIKIGVSTHDDLKALRKLVNFEPQGFVDLQEIVGKYGIEEMSLRKIAAIVLKYRISKSQQLTNWESEELTEKQIRYAATDSWVSREIYVALKKKQLGDDL